MVSGLGGYLFIFFARVIDMSCTTVRTLMIVRGQRLIAAIIGFFEVSVYIMALNEVVGKLNNPLNLLFYAAGFATGNYVGSMIEERMALGVVTVEIIPSDPESEMPDLLRQQEFGVTTFPAYGKEGPRQVLHVLLKRRMLPQLITMISEHDPKAFYTIMDARSTHGGFLGRQGK
ncbi:MAG: DUF2179 domain-containing protein [Firmicutes bacterium]|nr:DUF2179 domain-containing protein [Bacillota bacterium]